MPLEIFTESLTPSPELFPVAFDPQTGSVAFTRLTEADYAGASFLDGRLLAAHPAVRNLAWSEVAAAVATARMAEHVDFVFHIGHVGSTLLSRLLGRHPAIFCLREPEILRTLALMRVEDRENRAGILLTLLSRTFGP